MAVSATGNEKTQRNAEHDADAGDQQHLQQMDREDRAAGGAEALEGGDDLAAAIDVGGDRIGDADAADQQRGEPDQRQELAQPLERARDLRRGIAPVAHGEAALGQRLLDALAEGRRDRRPTGRLRRRASGRSASRPGCPDRSARRAAASRARRARAGRRSAARSSLSGSAAMVARIGTSMVPSERRSPTLRPSRSSRIGSTAAPGSRRMRLVERQAAGELDTADQRIGRIHALELDQRLLAAVGPPRHRAHGRRLAHAALLPQPGALLALGRPVRARQRHVAAEQRLALALEARAQRIGQRADAGDDRDAERDAGDEDVEAR